ncbi:EF-hand and coiled-coil domain-containing protein 1 [Erpetoichthys calabaricus]|uniref:EF-hand and coiled-coil domain-containing protein 1 n=1 Tax=Erpetoichthys calabaricus TaxID=27687 RepID=UPI002234DF98|nr:EF-hand and coiled-coil domain-containing protein 1 [Erpetoichthys calabaricus]
MTTVPTRCPRPARRSEWLHCALAHHFNPDLSAENEIVVLAMGIDQYLQEVFHHLAYYSGDDLISEQDFRLLCAVLALPEGEEETSGVCAALPRELGFKEFHARLCGYFSLRSGLRQPLAAETEHVERQIRLRCPRVRRRKFVSFDLSKDDGRLKKTCQRSGSILKLDKQRHYSGETRIEAEPNQQDTTLEVENACLRELVEDLRAALQGSDARCLALEVAIQKERESHSVSIGAGRKTHMVEIPPYCHKSKGNRCMKAIMKELELIRASRDGQLEEAMRFSHRVAEELRVATQEAHRLEEVISRLHQENADIKKKAEDARAALVNGLEKVREIQDQANTVPILKNQIQELELELQEFRSHCHCREENHITQQRPQVSSFDHWYPPTPQRRSPAGRDESSGRGEERLQRAVEGRAASDEEEEEQQCNAEEGQCCLTEVKKLLSQLSCSGKGCQNGAVRHMFMAHTGLQNDKPECAATLAESRAQSRRERNSVEGQKKAAESELERLLCSAGKNLQLKEEEAEMLRMELQMVETERVRLSLLEEKLADALALLLQLRAQNISRRALGKILMDILDICSQCETGSSHFPGLLDTLCQQLRCCELLVESTNGQNSKGQARSTVNSLIISC